MNMKNKFLLLLVLNFLVGCMDGAFLSDYAEQPTGRKLVCDDTFQARAGADDYYDPCGLISFDKLYSTVIIDGYHYKTVSFLGMTWMAENAKHEVNVVGAKTVLDSANNRFYNRIAAENACPIGWHLPTRHDLDSLQRKYGGNLGSYLLGENEGKYNLDEWETDFDGGIDVWGVELKGISYHFEDASNSGSFTKNNDRSAKYWMQSDVSDIDLMLTINSEVSLSIVEESSTSNAYMVRCVTGSFATPLSSSSSSSGSGSTSNTLTDSRDGTSYKTVIIGSQVWMAENLNYGTMVFDDIGQVDDGVVEKYCYNDDVTNCYSDGGLYTWAEAMALPSYCNGEYCSDLINSEFHQGICPIGWHMPKAEEWDVLAEYLGGASVAGARMKGNSLEFPVWNDLANNDGNSSGFSAIPVGFRNQYLGGYSDRGTYADFWESNEISNANAFLRYLSNSNQKLIGNYSDSKLYGFSVRCLRDLNASASSSSIALSSSSSSVITMSSSSTVVYP